MGDGLQIFPSLLNKFSQWPKIFGQRDLWCCPLSPNFSKTNVRNTSLSMVSLWVICPSCNCHVKEKVSLLPNWKGRTASLDRIPYSSSLFTPICLSPLRLCSFSCLRPVCLKWLPSLHLSTRSPSPALLFSLSPSSSHSHSVSPSLPPFHFTSAVNLTFQANFTRPLHPLVYRQSSSSPCGWPLKPDSLLLPGLSDSFESETFHGVQDAITHWHFTVTSHRSNQNCWFSLSQKRATLHSLSTSPTQRLMSWHLCLATQCVSCFSFFAMNTRIKSILREAKAPIAQTRHNLWVNSFCEANHMLAELGHGFAALLCLMIFYTACLELFQLLSGTPKNLQIYHSYVTHLPPPPHPPLSNLPLDGVWALFSGSLLVNCGHVFPHSSLLL